MSRARLALKRLGLWISRLEACHAPQWYASHVNASERRAARSNWEGRVFRGGWEEMADYDALFWDRIPLGERAEAVWVLSEELYEIADPETHERRLPRSAYRLERR
jgi:hypothetical protein